MKFPAFEPINLKNDIPSMEAIDLCLSKISPDQNQARKFFSDVSLDDLASSIRQHGIIQPIIVKEMRSNKNEYQIIAGERRWRAAKIAGLEKIPAIIRKYNKAHEMAVSLIENIQREDLNPLEEAHAIKRLIDECNMTHSEVAETLSRSRTTVTNLLRLLTLTDKVKEMLKTGLLEMGHARALLSLSSEQQEKFAEIVVNQSLSVRETEQLVQRSNNSKDRQEIFLSPQFEQRKKDWITQLSKKLSSTVNMHFTHGGKGKVVINFDSLEEADWLMLHLTVNE